MATEVASVTKPPAPAAEEKKKKVFFEKPEKPDEDVFKKNLAVAEKEHEEVKAKLNAIKEKLSLAQPNRNNGELNPVQARQNELKAELTTIRGKQSTRKSANQKVFDQIKTLESSMKAKQAEQKAARGKVPYKSVEDLEKAIADLDRQVESGKLKLVDERKALADISALRKQKKTFGSLETMQAEIDEDKAKIAELKKTTSDPEAKALSDRYTEIAAELDKYRAEQDEVYKNLSSLRDEKTQLQNLEREKYQAKKALEDQFYSAKSAYRNYERAAAEARREKFKAEREAKDREWKKQVARQKMEEAETPAYSSEILTCEGLIGHFDPTSPEALAGKNKGSLLEDKGLKATDIRVVDNEIKGTKLLKKDDREEDYFKGTGGKGKKGKKGGNKGAAATDAGTPTEQDKGKFQLNHGVLIELGKVDVAPPSGWDDVTKVLENLREKLSWYKENSERVTKENIAKAKKEIERLEAADEAATPASNDQKEGAESEEKTEEAKEETLAAAGEEKKEE